MMPRASCALVGILVLSASCMPPGAVESPEQAFTGPTCVPTRTPPPTSTTRTATPSLREFGTPPPYTRPTQTPYTRIDLAPGIPLEEKFSALVYRCNGTYQEITAKMPGVASTITETLHLNPGDILLSEWPSLPRVRIEPPPPPPATQVEGVTLEQAHQNALFHLFEPTLPDGLHLLYVTHWKSTPDDTYRLDYAGPTRAGKRGSFLVIIETYSPSLPTPPGGIPPTSTYEPTQEAVSLHGVRALVMRNASPPPWFTPEPPNQTFVALEWSENDVSLSVLGSMDLPELVKIAESLR